MPTRATSEMFDLIHEMRTRIITSPSFNGDRMLGAILFEDTMDREIEGRDTRRLPVGGQERRAVPEGRQGPGRRGGRRPGHEAHAGPRRPAAPGPGQGRVRHQDALGDQARPTKPASNAVVDQQFEIGRQILAAGLVPIIEPEVDIHSPDKARGRGAAARSALVAQLDRLGDDQQVMLKLTLPETDDFYAELVEHPKVLRVVALSGGYSREEANARLSRNHGVIASFSRALAEGLSAQQSKDSFDAALDSTIASISKPHVLEAGCPRCLQYLPALDARRRRPHLAVLIAHGMSEHSGRYRDACRLSDADFAVYAPDHRGHGGRRHRPRGRLGSRGIEGILATSTTCDSWPRTRSVAHQ